MTGIDELRSTLESHARDLPPVDPGSRAAAVRHRVAVQRRRRRTAVAGGVAAVLAAVGAVALVTPGGDRPQPADGPTVVGLSAPAELDALGYTYEIVQTVDGGGMVGLELAASGTERLVTWATADDDQRVTVRSDDSNDGLAYDVPDFGDVVVVPSGEPVDVRVTSETSDVGLAVYALTDAAPPGVSDGSVTFRRSVADRTLVDAVIGEPGQAEVTLRTVVPDGTLGYAELCVGAPEGSWVDVELGDGGFGTSCTGTSTFDPGASAMTTRSTPGRHTIRVRVTQGADGPLVDDPDLQIGLGLYQVPDDGPRAAGQRVPTVVEEAGHRWELTRVESNEPGDRLLRTTADEGARPQLVTLLMVGRTGTVQPSVDGVDQASFRSQLRTPSSGSLGPVTPGGEVVVRLQGTVGDDARMALAVYDVAD